MMLRAEAELVVLCVSPVESRARISELLESELDWEWVGHFADSHRLQQQFCCRLRAIRPSAAPPGLDEVFHRTLRNSLLLTRDLVGIVDLFRRAGIDALPFKGPALALQAYGSIPFRSFDDLDILIRKEEVWKARDVLQAAGYQPKLDLNPAREADCLDSYDEYLMRGEGGVPLVELHWGFVPPQFGLKFGFDDCWPAREHLTLANREIPTLNSGDLLLVLSAHGAKHGWSYLGLVTDLAWLVVNQAMDWAALVGKARRLGILRMLLVAVNLAKAVFGIALAPVVREAIAADRAVDVLTAEITDSLFEQNGRARHDEKAIAQSGWLHMRLRERWGDRVRYAVRLTTRSGVEDWEAVDLPGSLSFLYPLLRFPRLVMKYRSRVP
jgi:hypothetical protein